VRPTYDWHATEREHKVLHYCDIGPANLHTRILTREAHLRPEARHEIRLPVKSACGLSFEI
jgi:hypothetical protein